MELSIAPFIKCINRLLRLVFTSEGVGVGVGVVSGVVRATESESEESELKVSISSDSAYDSVAYVPLMI